MFSETNEMIMLTNRVELLARSMAAAYASQDWKTFNALKDEYEEKSLQVRTRLLEMGVELPPLRCKIILDY